MLNLVMTQGPLAQLYQWHEVKRPSGDDREGRSREGRIRWKQQETLLNFLAAPSLAFWLDRQNIACVAAGPRIRKYSPYALYRRFRASATQATKILPAKHI